MWEDLDVSGKRDKRSLFDDVEDRLGSLELGVVEKDIGRPWGGYFRIDADKIETFLKTFFSGVSLPNWAGGLNFDPKILLVAPRKRLSWQYHKRRGEFWKVIKGPVRAYLSEGDELPEAKVFQTGDTVEVPVGNRHRLGGEANWGVVAEIWVHTDRDNPSDEVDIVRLADDFGRA